MSDGTMVKAGVGTVGAAVTGIAVAAYVAT
jgi:hypothetical protein